jgi:transcriptional regulator with XRE-family HTH domain
MDDQLNTPGKRLKWARENKTSHTNATAAATAFGWPVSTYLGHENGDRVPKISTAKKYAAAYRVRWDWLLEGASGRPSTLQPRAEGLNGRGNRRNF